MNAKSKKKSLAKQGQMKIVAEQEEIDMIKEISEQVGLNYSECVVALAQYYQDTQEAVFKVIQMIEKELFEAADNGEVPDIPGIIASKPAKDQEEIMRLIQLGASMVMQGLNYDPIPNQEEYIRKGINQVIGRT